MGDELANVAAFAKEQMERAEKAEAERDELQATYDLFSDAWRRADAIWVAQDPEQRSKRRPGLAEQIVWLVAELEKAQSERDEARRELAEAEEAIRKVEPRFNVQRSPDDGGRLYCAVPYGWPDHPAVRRALERKP